MNADTLQIHYLPDPEKLAQIMRNAAGAINAVCARLDEVIQSVIATWRNIAPFLTRLERRESLAALRRHRHARRAYARASRRARSGERWASGAKAETWPSQELAQAISAVQPPCLFQPVGLLDHPLMLDLLAEVESNLLGQRSEVHR